MFNKLFVKIIGINIIGFMATVSFNFAGAPQALQGTILSFLTFKDRGNAASVCKDLRIRAWQIVERTLTPWFLLNMGELTPTEKEDASFNCVREYRDLKSMQYLPKVLVAQKVLVLDEGRVSIVSRQPQGFWDSLAYYLGFTHNQVGDHLVQISNRRIAQIKEFLQQDAPTNLIEFRNICFRASNFAQETLSMRDALKMDVDALNQDIEALSCLAYYVCKFVQWLLSLIFSTPGLAQHNQLNSNITEMNALLVNLNQGKFNNTPNSTCGVRISDFRMSRCAEHNRPTERDVGIYAFPTSYENSVQVLTGKTVFVLSEDGTNWLGDLSINYNWAPTNGGLELTEDCWPVPTGVILRRSALDISTPYFTVRHGADDNDRVFNGDRPVMKALMQLSVELFARLNEKTLKYHSVYDHAHVLLSGGAINNNDIGRTRRPTQTEEIWNRIREARAAHRKFPEYRDEQGIEMQFKNSPKKPVLNVKVDFGDGETTWGAIILSNPMLKQPSKDPILPAFWRHNLFRLEAPAIEAPEELEVEE